MRKNREIDYVSCGRIAAALAIGIGIIIFFFGPIITKAVSTFTDTQVTITYYNGKPSMVVSYDEAYSLGDSNVEKVTYTTKSKGRLQWGEQNTDGSYDVYYDAKDIHTLAAYLNESWESYNDMYDAYVEAYTAVTQ